MRSRILCRWTTPTCLGRLSKYLVFVVQDGDAARRLYVLFPILLMIGAAP